MRKLNEMSPEFGELAAQRATQVGRIGIAKEFQSYADTYKKLNDAIDSIENMGFDYIGKLCYCAYIAKYKGQYYIIYNDYKYTWDDEISYWKPTIYQIIEETTIPITEGFFQKPKENNTSILNNFQQMPAGIMLADLDDGIAYNMVRYCWYMDLYMHRADPNKTNIIIEYTIKKHNYEWPDKPSILCDESIKAKQMSDRIYGLTGIRINKQCLMGPDVYVFPKEAYQRAGLLNENLNHCTDVNWDAYQAIYDMQEETEKPDIDFSGCTNEDDAMDLVCDAKYEYEKLIAHKLGFQEVEDMFQSVTKQDPDEVEWMLFQSFTDDYTDDIMSFEK